MYQNISYTMIYFQSSREQLAIAEFARSLLVIPKQLAVNAAQDSTDLVAKLRAYHNMSQTKEENRDMRWCVVYLKPRFDKLVLRVSNKVRNKPGCTTAEDG